MLDERFIDKEIRSFYKEPPVFELLIYKYDPTLSEEEKTVVITV